MNFFPNKSAILAYECHIPSGRRFIEGLPISATHRVKDLLPRRCGSINFHAQAVCQIANSNRTNDLIAEIFCIV